MTRALFIFFRCERAQVKCALSALGPWHVTSQGSPKTFPSGQQAAVGGGTLGIIVGLCQGGFAEFELSARWSNESKEKRKGPDPARRTMRETAALQVD